jgi:hypothetical protein
MAMQERIAASIIPSSNTWEATYPRCAYADEVDQLSVDLWIKSLLGKSRALSNSLIGIKEARELKKQCIRLP